MSKSIGENSRWMISCILKAIKTSFTSPSKSVTGRRRKKSASGLISGMQDGSVPIQSFTRSGNQRLGLDSKRVLAEEGEMNSQLTMNSHIEITETLVRLYACRACGHGFAEKSSLESFE